MTVHDLQPAVHDRLTPQQTFGLELCHRHAGALALLASLILEDDDAADEVVSETIAAVSLYADQPAARDVTRVLLARRYFESRPTVATALGTGSESMIVTAGPLNGGAESRHDVFFRQ